MVVYGVWYVERRYNMANLYGKEVELVTLIADTIKSQSPTWTTLGRNEIYGYDCEVEVNNKVYLITVFHDQMIIDKKNPRARMYTFKQDPCNVDDISLAINEIRNIAIINVKKARAKEKEAFVEELLADFKA